MRDESHSERAARIADQYVDELPFWSALETSVLPTIHRIARRFDRSAYVESRLKSSTSLVRKLSTRSTEVTRLHDITDLLGVRVVTLHLDSIGPIVDKIEEAFRVDSRKSGLRTNSAGYRTRHIVCAIEGEPAGRWFEVQVRTAGEHVWSELQHPIYKGSAADDRTTQTLARIATLYHEADLLAAALRRRLHNGSSNSSHHENARLQEFGEWAVSEAFPNNTQRAS